MELKGTLVEQQEEELDRLGDNAEHIADLEVEVERLSTDLETKDVELKECQVKLGGRRLREENQNLTSANQKLQQTIKVEKNEALRLKRMLQESEDLLLDTDLDEITNRLTAMKGMKSTIEKNRGSDEKGAMAELEKELKDTEDALQVSEQRSADLAVRSKRYEEGTYGLARQPSRPRQTIPFALSNRQPEDTGTGVTPEDDNRVRNEVRKLKETNEQLQSVNRQLQNQFEDIVAQIEDNDCSQLIKDNARLQKTIKTLRMEIIEANSSFLDLKYSRPHQPSMRVPALSAAKNRMSLRPTESDNIAKDATSGQGVPYTKYMDLKRYEKMKNMYSGSMASLEHMKTEKMSTPDAGKVTAELGARITKLQERNGLLREQIREKDHDIAPLKENSRTLNAMVVQAEERITASHTKIRSADESIADIEKDYEKVLKDRLRADEENSAAIRRLQDECEARKKEVGLSKEELNRALRDGHQKQTIGGEELNSLREENEKLRKELVAFDPSFFEETEDLKYNYKVALEHLALYEETGGSAADHAST
eukprot:Clim_evm26s141 gene=Clim_evmTU26s141